MKLPSPKTLLWLCAFAVVLDFFSVLTVTVLPWNATDGIHWQTDGSWFGLVAGSVKDPASRAGVRAGDRVDVRAVGAANGWSNPATGVPEHIVGTRDGHSIERTVVSVKLPLWWPSIVRAVAVLW